LLEIDHVNIHARDPGAIVAFLEAALGAAEGERPPFKHPGHWVYLDGRPVFHVDHARGDEGSGLVDHVAIGVFDYAALVARLDAANIPYHVAGIPGGVGQLFVEGPEGLKLELQYGR
jgi:catechol 2,3-dioxygenase-like lactoylglutathione lyase family enzyme